MNEHGQKNTLKVMTGEDLKSRGWSVPSFEQLYANMEKRLKKIRGEETSDESFPMRHNYTSNSAYCKE